MSGFIVVVATLVYFSAVAFLLLFANQVGDNDELADDMDDDTALGLRKSSPVSRFFYALLTMFNMGILGNFSTEGFASSANQEWTTILFIIYMVLVMVVALNAVIAVLGDSFEKVQERKTAEQNRERAGLIIEYYDTMSVKQRNDLEIETTWTHSLVPQSEYSAGGDEQWVGKIKAINKTINKSSADMSVRMNRLELTMGTLQADLNHTREEMVEKLNAVLAAVDAKI